MTSQTGAAKADSAKVMRAFAARLRQRPLVWQLTFAVLLGVFAGGAGLNSRSLLVVAGASVAFAVGALWTYSPHVALLAFVAARPLADLFVYVDLGGLSVGQIWGAVFLVMGAAYLALEGPSSRKSSASDRRISAAPLAFVLGYIALTFTRPDLPLAVVMALRLTSWLMLAVVVERIAQTVSGQSRVAKTMLVYAVLLVGVVACLVALNRYGANYYSSMPGSGIERLESTAQGPGGLAAMAVFVLPMVLLFAYVGRRRMPALGLAALLAVAIILSYRRTAYIALACIGTAFVFLAASSRSIRLKVSALVLTGATFIALYAFRATIERRFGALLQAFDGGREATLGTGGRLEFWQAVGGYYVAHPSEVLFGGGAHASIDIISTMAGYRVWAHNDFLETLTSGGIVLLALYVWLLVWMFRSVLKVQRDPMQSPATRGFAGLAAATLVAFIVYSVFTGVVFGVPSLAIGVLVGVVRGMRHTRGYSYVDALVVRSREGSSPVRPAGDPAEDGGAPLARWH